MGERKVKQITQIGATTQEAISLALQKLGKTLEQVDVEVLQEGKKGFLGFGSRPAEVRVTLKETVDVHFTVDNTLKESTDIASTAVPIVQVSEVQMDEKQQVENESNPIEDATSYLLDIAKQMGIEDLQVNVETEGKYTIFKLESEKAALLIGKRGQTLNSLQQLTQLVINKSAKTYMLVKLDVENYRERRQEALELLANRMADKAVRLNNRVEFEPMPSYERKIIHNALSNRLDIETYSEGNEPNRYLVIEPIK